MRFTNFIDSDHREALGVVTRDAGRGATLKELGFDFESMEALIEAYTTELGSQIDAKLEQLGGHPLDSITIGSPLPHPRNTVVCVGLNYEGRIHEHYRFWGEELRIPKDPVYLFKKAFRTIADKSPVPGHADVARQLDYECELAVVIGKGGDCLEPEEVFDHIFGYTVANDISARNLQHSFYTGVSSKRSEGLLPLGPWIVTKDEFSIPPSLQLRTFVNGEERQHGNTSEVLFDIPYLVSELSFDRDLEPGDLILTGTPAGTGMGFDPPRFLKAGDVVRCEIEGIGALTNTII